MEAYGTQSTHCGHCLPMGDATFSASHPCGARSRRRYTVSVVLSHAQGCEIARGFLLLVVKGEGVIHTCESLHSCLWCGSHHSTHISGVSQDVVLWGIIRGGDALASLLRLLASVFSPSLLSSTSWPRSVRSDFTGRGGTFTESVIADAHTHMHAHTLTDTCALTCMCTYADLDTHAHTYTHLHTHTHMHLSDTHIHLQSHRGIMHPRLHGYPKGATCYDQVLRS
jgi:hypothetical protein